MAQQLFAIGLSWKTAPIAIREQVAFADDEIATALAELLVSQRIDEALILSTCNRVEIYGATPRAQATTMMAATAEVRRFLARSRGVSGELLASHLYEHVERDAVCHAFRVAASLDSMVVGEPQILGQLKDAYGAAVRVGASGAVLGRWMERAFRVGKRVRSETGISRGAANVSSVAVELAGHVFGELTGKQVLVVGAGKMSSLAARHLRADGAGALYVTNRSPERGQALAIEIEGVARPWAELPALLTAADVVITSTGAREPVLTRSLIKPAMKRRRRRPLIIIDIAVPRDADPAIGKLDGVYLFDIDDLKRVVNENLKERAREAEAGERIIDGEVTEFEHWLRTQQVVPTIRALRAHFITVARAEAEKVVRGLGDRSPEQREQAVLRLADLIVNKLLHQPMTALRNREEPDVEALVAAAHRLFALSSADAGAAVGADGGDEVAERQPARREPAQAGPAEAEPATAAAAIDALEVRRRKSRGSA